MFLVLKFDWLVILAVLNSIKVIGEFVFLSSEIILEVNEIFFGILKKKEIIVLVFLDSINSKIKIF